MSTFWSLVYEFLRDLAYEEGFMLSLSSLKSRCVLTEG